MDLALCDFCLKYILSKCWLYAKSYKIIGFVMQLIHTGTENKCDKIQIKITDCYTQSLASK